MGTMLVTTLLTFFVLRYDWRYPLWLCVLATAFFLLIDAVFFAAALHKVLDGGWFPLALAAIVFCVMVTWRRGREALLERLRGSSPPLEGFLKALFLHPPAAGPRHGRISHVEPGCNAERAAAQPQALQGAARAERVPDG